MRKINLFWINRKPNITFFNKIKNSLLEEIKIEDGIFTTFFHSYWNKPEKIQIVLINLWNLDKKDLMVFFSKIIKISFDTAKRLSRENMPEYCNYYEKELLSTIDSCLIKINYSKEKD